MRDDPAYHRSRSRAAVPKDESTHPTGSLKPRLARSLFCTASAMAVSAKAQPLVEASSGSTAVSEAYFAKLLGLQRRTTTTPGSGRTI